MRRFLPFALALLLPACQIGEFAHIGGPEATADASKITIVDNTPIKEPQEPVASHLPAIAQWVVAGGAAIFDPIAGAVVFLGMGWLQGVQNLATVRGTGVHAIVGGLSEIEATWEGGNLKTVRITPVKSGKAGDVQGPQPE